MVCSVAFTSCYSDKVKKEHSITKPTRIVDTLYPKKDGSYTTKILKLKGRADDSIYFSINNGYKFY